MKKILLILVCLFSLVAVRAAGGDRPSKDSNQKSMKMYMPDLDATVFYFGGDTLYLEIDHNDAEQVHIKLMGDNVTLLNDRLKHSNHLKRVYVISAFPEGDYKIRLKKGNYVVEKSFTKTTAACPAD
jgi:hypothetical protein